MGPRKTRRKGCCRPERRRRSRGVSWRGRCQLEEEVVAKAVNAGIGAEAFGAEMDKRVAEFHPVSIDDELDALFGDYDGVDHSKSAAAVASSNTNSPPRIFTDTFTYTRAMLQRLAAPVDGIFDVAPVANEEDRLIKMRLPADMMSDGGLGYSRTENVDDRYMPAECVGPGNYVELTDRTDIVNVAIQQAKTDERSWPTVQYLWDGHPILGWFADRAETFFSEGSAPLCGLRGRLAPGETVVVLHGAVPNALGAPVVDKWAAVSVCDGRVAGIESLKDFMGRSGLAGNTSNSGTPDAEAARKASALAVHAFQTDLVGVRKAREKEIEEGLNAVLDRLSHFSAQFRQQLELQFADLPGEGRELSVGQRRQKVRRDNRAVEIEELFDDWASWHDRTRRMVNDPNPYVEVKAVFQG